MEDGRRVWTHERLRKARGVLDRLVRERTLFAFAEMAEERGGRWSSNNNAVESGNVRPRGMLRHHRGMPFMHRAKAVFWWCYMHSESPLPPAGILRAMPTDDEVGGLFAAASEGSRRKDGAPGECGTDIVCEEFLIPTIYKQ